MAQVPSGSEQRGNVALASAREQYRASLVQLEAAYHVMQDALRDGTEALLAIRSHLDRGGSAQEFVHDMLPQPLRATIAHALDDWERARHESNRLLWRLLLAEGHTHAEIARSFGVSRQLVSRLLHETG